MNHSIINRVLKETLKMTPEDRISFLTMGLAPERDDEDAPWTAEEMQKIEMIPTFLETHCCNIAGIEPRQFKEKEDKYAKKWIKNAGRLVNPDKANDIDTLDEELYFYLEPEFFAP